MSINEVITILRKIKTAYYLFELNEAVVELWIEALEEMPFIDVLNNVNQHIKTNAYAPHIAQIAAHKKVQNEFIEKYYERVTMLNAKR